MEHICTATVGQTARLGSIAVEISTQNPARLNDAVGQTEATSTNIRMSVESYTHSGYALSISQLAAVGYPNYSAILSNSTKNIAMQLAVPCDTTNTKQS